MNKIELEIDKRDAYDNLHRISAHLGMKLQAAEFIASTVDDEQRIEPMWNMAVGELQRLLQPYSSLVLPDDKAVFELNMPANWRDDQYATLATHCRIYILNALYAAWLDTVKPDSAAFYRTLNQNTISAIKHILELRKKPQR